MSCAAPGPVLALDATVYRGPIFISYTDISFILQIVTSSKVVQCFFWPSMLCLVCLVWIVMATIEVYWPACTCCRRLKRYIRNTDIMVDGEKDDKVGKTQEPPEPAEPSTEKPRENVTRSTIKSMKEISEKILIADADGVKKRALVEAMKKQSKLFYTPSSQTDTEPERIPRTLSSLVRVIKVDTFEKDASGPEIRRQLEAVRSQVKESKKTSLCCSTVESSEDVTS